MVGMGTMGREEGFVVVGRALTEAVVVFEYSP